MSFVKPKLNENISKYQIGTKTGHRAQEHLFVLKSAIALQLRNNKSILISLYDISKFFDRECLRDGLDAVYNYGIKGKLYRLLYMMNKDNIIKVRTAVGDSDERYTGENIGQGTQEGAILSAASIDYTVRRFFQNSSDEFRYGCEDIHPLLFQDDICRISASVESVQNGNNSLENVMETKLLDFNIDKSCTVVIGPRAKRNDTLEQIKATPLSLCNQTMKIVEAEKYLGDYISAEGLSESVWLTVMKRKPRTMISIFEAKSVVQDCRSTTIGGLRVAIDIWEVAILPYLLHNSETWVDMKKKTVKVLNQIQVSFLRNIFATPRTCPTPILLWDTGCLLMEHRVAKQKLLFIHHLLSLPDESLASQIARAQDTNSYPGLIKECRMLLELYNLPDPKSLSKWAWKRLVKKQICRQNEIDLSGWLKQYKKMKSLDIGSENCCIKEYILKLNVPDARLMFAIRAKMTRTVQMNYKGVRQFKSNGWKCYGCGSLDTQDHLLTCAGYQHLRSDKNLCNEKELIHYIREVIHLRENS